MFADDLQVLVWKIIARKTEFRTDANEQLKSQYAHKLKDLYYAAISHSMLQSSDSMESFTQFWGHLAMTFGGHSKLGKAGFHTAVVEVSSCVISEAAGEHRLSKNLRQRQNKINQQATQISSLEAQNKKLGQLLEPKFLMETITQAVASSLKRDKTTKLDSSPGGYTSKALPGKAMSIPIGPRCGWFIRSSINLPVL